MARYMLINLLAISGCLMYAIQSGSCAPLESEVTSENGTVYKIKVYDAQRPPPPRFESLKQGKRGSDDGGDETDGGDSDNDGTPKVVFQQVIYAPPPVYMSAKQDDDSNIGDKNLQSNNQNIVIQEVRHAPPPVIVSSRIIHDVESSVSTDEDDTKIEDSNGKPGGSTETPGSDEKKSDGVDRTVAGVEVEVKNSNNHSVAQKGSSNELQTITNSNDNVVNDNSNEDNHNPASLNNNDKNPSTVAKSVINSDPDKPILGNSAAVDNKLDKSGYSDDTSNDQDAVKSSDLKSQRVEDKDTSYDSDNSDKMVNKNANGDEPQGDGGNDDNADEDDKNGETGENKEGGSNTVKVPTDVQGNSEESDEDNDDGDSDHVSNSKFDDDNGEAVANGNVSSQSDINSEVTKGEDGRDGEDEEEKEYNRIMNDDDDDDDTGEVDGKSKPVSNGDLSDQIHYEKKMMSNESESTHFMSYFLVATVFIACFYLVFHNRRKIKAYILDERQAGHRRKVGASKYHQLNTAEEVLPPASKGLE